jgi:hypothetical protein
MWQALIVAGIVLATFSGKAQANTCTVSDILALQKQGLTQQQIETKCLATTALPTWLNGDWQVYRQEGNSPANRLAMGMLGISQDIWRIRVTGNTLSVAVLMNHHLGAPYIVERPQRVFDLHLGAQVVHFKVRGELGEVTQFSLHLTDEENIAGAYATKDNWLPGLPGLELSGTVVMKKLS